MADDFTGACDAAGAFGASARTLVFTRIPDEWPAAADVLAIDLDVRERTDVDAARAIGAAAHLRSDRVLLKIDSTLRGPVRGLIGAALDSFQRELACVAPAFPEQGRVVRNGRLQVRGQEGPSLREVIGDDERCVIHNAESPEDLLRVTQQAEAHPEWLLVGSAGLARQLAPPCAAPILSPPGSGSVLVVAGSPTSVTRAQLAQLHGLDPLVVFATQPTEARDDGAAAEALAVHVMDWAKLHTPRAVVLTGGATARAVIHRMHATSIRILGEVQPGIPVGSLQDGPWHGVTVVTKAGGFGTPETLVDIVRTLGVSS